MLDLNVDITQFKCPVCGFQLGVYVDRPDAVAPVYRLVVQMWGGPWHLIDSCPKCHHMPVNDWLKHLANKELDEADNLPF